jgi:predicted KAP-like P-loop ATPase
MGGSHYGSDWESQWRAGLKVCSPERFERYFRLTIPQGAISEAEFRSFIALLPDPQEFASHAVVLCTELGPHGHTSRAKEFLERATDFAEHQATESQLEPLFQALFRLGDAFLSAKDEHAVSLITITNERRLGWALQATLERIGDQRARDTLVESTYELVDAIRTASMFLWILGRDHGEFGPDKEDSDRPARVSKECLQRLKSLVLDRINEDAKTGRLITHPDAMLVVRDWRLFGGELDAQAWVKETAQQDRFLVRILNQLRSQIRSHSASDRVVRTMPFIDGKYLLSFFEASDIRGRCNRIISDSPEWLDDYDRETLAVVLDTVMEDGMIRDAFSRTPVATERVTRETSEPKDATSSD